MRLGNGDARGRGAHPMGENVIRSQDHRCRGSGKVAVGPARGRRPRRGGCRPAPWQIWSPGGLVRSRQLVPIGQFAIFLAQGEAGRHTRTIPAQIRRGETGAVVEKFRGV